MSSDTNKELIRLWHEQFAPGLEPQTIPDGAEIEGLIEPLNPYGLQYCLRLKNGDRYPRHQSGPGVTVAITDGARIALRLDRRVESNAVILKCCGGFAGRRTEVARDIVAINHRMRDEHVVCVTDGEYPDIRAFITELVGRECSGFSIADRTLEFIDRPIGNPNIRICSIMGSIRISPTEFSEHRWPLAASLDEAKSFCDEWRFGDENTYRLVRRLCSL